VVQRGQFRDNRRCAKEFAGWVVLGLPDGEEIMSLAFFVLTQYRRVTDGQTDGQTRCDRYYPR